MLLALGCCLSIHRLSDRRYCGPLLATHNCQDPEGSLAPGSTILCHNFHIMTGFFGDQDFRDVKDIRLIEP
jgi:hypothetical protein